MKNCFFIAFLVCVLGMHAQSSKKVEANQLTLNFLLPGLVYEIGVSENSTFTGEATLGFAYQESTFFGNGFGVYPIGKIPYRDYYNFNRRMNKGKRISGNTGNYTAPTVAIQGGNALIGNLDYASSYTIALGAVYGIQRTFPSGLQFRLEAVPAYFIDEFSNNVDLLLSAKVGWILGKGKSK
ncbi:hypothetical protein [Maribacter flavus]|uniref:DUF3575 domain-containing protein n=1 Tax=Maribacter flavus TaxID=1658664 RepID=A0A5B2TUY8_9FLAO|nr:hypothetical protein [Maribacter flavus]KAA2218356.1 hypothetical protein F0361_01670 [Maribacter flavus]